MTDDQHLALGAYVLGGLTAAQRSTFETHLEQCPQCRAELADAAAVPTLLNQLRGGTQARNVLDASVPPSTPLLDAARERALRRRGLRRRVAGALVAAAAVAAFTTTALLDRGSSTTPAIAMHGRDAATSATASLTAKPWGTAVSLKLVGLPRSGAFDLMVRGRHGVWDRAASWAATADGRAELTGSSAVTSDSITELQVERSDGTVVVRLH